MTMNRQINTRENREDSVKLEALKEVINASNGEKYLVGETITTSRSSAKEILKKMPGVFRISVA